MNMLLKLIPHRPRWLNKRIAGLLGYFWLPCPICKKPFAGYEWRGNRLVFINDIVPEVEYIKAEIVCYKKECKEAAKDIQNYFEINKTQLRIAIVRNISTFKIQDVSNCIKDIEEEQDAEAKAVL